MAKISQREARNLKKRVAELEAKFRDQLNNWSGEWPGGAHIGTIEVTAAHFNIAKTARALGHAVVVVPVEFPKLHLCGCPLPK